MKWPADRKFTDAQGKILDHWRGPLGKLEPLLDLSPQQIAALLAMIQASLNPDDETDPGAAINLAFPIDSEPLADEDWLIEYKNSANAGRRILISTLLAMVSGPAIIGTADLTGNADVSISIPSGYRDAEVRVINLAVAATATPTIALSEDGGSTFLTQHYNQFTNGATLTNNSTTPPFYAAMNNTQYLNVRSAIRDYTSATAKITFDQGLYWASNGVTTGWAGARFAAASAAPINLIKVAVSGTTFTSGRVDVLGTL